MKAISQGASYLTYMVVSLGSPGREGASERGEFTSRRVERDEADQPRWGFCLFDYAASYVDVSHGVNVL